MGVARVLHTKTLAEVVSPEVDKLARGQLLRLPTYRTVAHVELRRVR